MPPRNELPSGISRDKFVNILIKLGFEVSKKGGKGSHYKATWPRTQKSITIPKDLRKDVLYYVIVNIEKITQNNITWEEIKKEL